MMLAGFLTAGGSTTIGPSATIAVIGGLSIKVYSRLMCAVYGQSIETCIVSNGSRTGRLPVNRIMPSAMLILAVLRAGRPLTASPGRR